MNRCIVESHAVIHLTLSVGHVNTVFLNNLGATRLLTRHENGSGVRYIQPTAVRQTLVFSHQTTSVHCTFQILTPSQKKICTLEDT